MGMSGDNVYVRGWLESVLIARDPGIRRANAANHEYRY